LYGVAQFRNKYVTLRSHRNYSKLTAVGLVALACALAGCGRKGGLDLPPSASTPQQSSNMLEDPGTGSAAIAQGNLYEPSPGSDKALIAPKGPKRRIILDPLLD
jgi:predicted small lipoprotein YifL